MERDFPGKGQIGVQNTEGNVFVDMGLFFFETAFFNLSELNRAIDTLLTELKNRPFQKLSGSRRSLFEEVEKVALKPLPQMRYKYVKVEESISSYRLPRASGQAILICSLPTRKRRAGYPADDPYH